MFEPPSSLWPLSRVSDRVQKRIDNHLLGLLNISHKPPPVFYLFSDEQIHSIGRNLSWRTQVKAAPLAAVVVRAAANKAAVLPAVAAVNGAVLAVVRAAVVAAVRVVAAVKAAAPADLPAGAVVAAAAGTSLIKHEAQWLCR